MSNTVNANEEQTRRTLSDSLLSTLVFEGKATIKDERKFRNLIDIELIPYLNSQIAVISGAIKKNIEEYLPAGIDVAVDIQFSSGSIMWTGLITVDGLATLPKHLNDVIKFSINKVVRKQIESEFAIKNMLTNARQLRRDPPSAVRSTEQNLSVFLCHSSSDKPTVRMLYQRLFRDGIDVWLDEENLLPGQDWQMEIRKAVRNSDIVLVCLSKTSISKSGYVQKEIVYALNVADEQPEGTIFLIPAKLEECDIPERLQRWHCVNLFDEHGYQRLMQAMKFRADTLEIDFRSKT